MRKTNIGKNIRCVSGKKQFESSGDFGRVDRPEFNKEGGTIIRKYNNSDNETLHKRMYFQKHSINKDDVGRST